MPRASAEGPSGSRRVFDDIYDPNQDLAEKRRLRQEYRRLIVEAEESRKEMDNVTVEDLQGMIEKSGELYKRVKAPTEGLLDARLLANVGVMGRTMAQNERVEGVGVDLNELMNKVAVFIGGGAKVGKSQRSRSRRRKGGRAKVEDDDEDDDLEEEDELDAIEDWDWDKLGRTAAAFSRRAPTMDFLLGPLKADYKKRTVTKRIVVDRAAEVERPEELGEQDIEKNANETTKVIEDIHNLLQSHPGGAPMFNFAIDPTSFGNTIENLFYVSFLIRDGVAAMIMPGEEENPDGDQPLLLSCEPPKAEDYKEGLNKRQIVLEMDMDTWKGLVQTYDIQNSIIPSRKYQRPRAQASGKWYG